MLVAPTGKLSRAEVEAFFPDFFEELADQCQQTMVDHAVQLTLDEHAPKAGGKMRLESAV